MNEHKKDWIWTVTRILALARHENLVCWSFGSELEARAKFEEQVRIYGGHDRPECEGVGITLWAAPLDSPLGGDSEGLWVRNFEEKP